MRNSTTTPTATPNTEPTNNKSDKSSQPENNNAELEFVVQQHVPTGLTFKGGVPTGLTFQSEIPITSHTTTLALYNPDETPSMVPSEMVPTVGDDVGAAAIVVAPPTAPPAKRGTRGRRPAAATEAHPRGRRPRKDVATDEAAATILESVTAALPGCATNPTTGEVQ